VLNSIYEADFLGFSYGFRPGRSPHDALDALAAGIKTKRVSYVLDADIRDYFTSLDQSWLAKFLEHRIADQRVLRLIQKWLTAGVIENGKWSETVQGTAQGASASPLLANVYLHYVLDLWADQWRRHAHGDVIIVRFADDYVAGFEHRDDAERFLHDLRERFAKFALELHPEKTRLMGKCSGSCVCTPRRADFHPPAGGRAAMTTNRVRPLRCRATQGARPREA
jgi:group II intron reverse transcriptase/maturase